MAVNVTEFIDDPFGVTFSTFTDLLGTPFYLILISVIGAALFVKTRDPMMLGMYLISSGALLSGGGIFVGAIHMIPFYVIIIALGLTSMFIGLILRK